jgi:hypothetical protein
MSDDRFKDQPPPPAPARPFNRPRQPYYVTADEIDEFNKRFAPVPKKPAEQPQKRDELVPEGSFGNDDK